MATVISHPASGQQSTERPTPRDFRQEVTDNIVRMLENGVAPWQKPWEPGASSFGIPMNPTSGRAYRGGNAIHLMATALRKGYEDPRWMTYKQAVDEGWQVRKGEKGTQIEFWEVKPASERSESIRPDDRLGRNPNSNDRDPDRPRLIHRVYTVFNGQQIDRIPLYTPKQHTRFEAVHAGEQILKNSGAQIAHDQPDRAFYSRKQDCIHLPPKDAFKDPAGYYGTALHELSHWTGHPSRLNRSTLNETYRFGDVNYAKEELRAELASVFLAAERGIPHDPEQHAAYAGSWIKALKEDKNEIFRAAHDASAAADFLLALEREKSLGDEDLSIHSGTQSPEESVTATATLEQEMEEIHRDRERLEESELTALTHVESAEQTGSPKLAPGDKIIAHEPYYYGGKPRENPETPAIVQSLYHDGSMVSYMRLNDSVNGNKSLEYGDMRHATPQDLQKYSTEFAELENRFRESLKHVARYEPGSGTVNVNDKQNASDQRTTAPAPAAPSKLDTGPNRDSSRSESLESARSITRQTLGNESKLLLAQTDSGTYRGLVIGDTEHHVVQRQSDKSAIAHPKESLNNLPEVGRTVRINYSNDRGSVRELRDRSKVKGIGR
jgi:antirestriction protein ArdC